MPLMYACDNATLHVCMYACDNATLHLRASMCMCIYVCIRMHVHVCMHMSVLGPQLKRIWNAIHAGMFLYTYHDSLNALTVPAFQNPALQKIHRCNFRQARWWLGAQFLCVCIHMCLHVCMYICMHACVCICAYMYVYVPHHLICVSVYVYVCMHVYTHTHTHTHIYIYAHKRLTCVGNLYSYLYDGIHICTCQIYTHT